MNPDYEIKDKGITSNTEETSVVSVISYEVENALVNNIPEKSVVTELKL